MRSAAGKWQEGIRNVRPVDTLDGHFLRHLGITTDPGNRHHRCIGHHGGTQGKHLAGNGLAGAIAEGDMDRAILDGQRTYMIAHNLLFRWQSCGGIVGWEGM